jgi:hypothetical protein
MVDCCLLATFVAVITATALLQIVFPPASAAAGWRLWGLDFDGWMRVHSFATGVFALLVLLHLILHWNWVCMFVASRLSKALNRRIAIGEAVRTIYGVSLLIIVLTLMGLVLAAAEFQIVQPSAG